jgi:hypothetical protein
MPFGSWPLLIPVAKPEIRTIHVWWTVENLVFQDTSGRENDFAISIAFGECQVMGPPVATGWLVSPLISEEFQEGCLPLARGHHASATLITKSGQEPVLSCKTQSASSFHTGR